MPATRIREHQKISPPEGCHASIVIRLVATRRLANGKEEGSYVCWLLVGRFGVEAANADYVHLGGAALRIDVPNGTPISHEFLHKELSAYMVHDPTLPPETPVIRGIGGAH